MSQRDKIRKCLRQLNLQIPVQEVIDALLGDGVLTTQEWEFICTAVDKTGKYAGNHHLMRLMLGKHDSRIAQFMVRLREISPELAGDVDQSEIDEQQLRAKEFEEAIPWHAILSPGSSPSGLASPTYSHLSLLVEERLLHLSVQQPLPNPSQTELEDQREELARQRAEIVGLNQTVSELICSEFEDASKQLRTQAVVKARVRHPKLYQNTPGSLQKFYSKGRLPPNVKGCNACPLNGFIYASVARVPTGVRKLLRCPVDGLGEGNWRDDILPLSADYPAWTHVKIFADSSRLFCAVTPERKTQTYSVFGRDSDDWRFLVDLPEVRYDFRIAYAHGQLVVAGGFTEDMKPNRDIIAYPIDSLGLVKPTWVTVATDPCSRCIPAVVADDDNIYVLGGTAGEPHDYDSPATVTTLRRLARQTYEAMPGAVCNMPVYGTFATSVNGNLIIAGGRTIPSTSFSIGELTDLCYAYDVIKKRWCPMATMRVPQCNPELFCYENRLYCCWGMLDDDATGSHDIEVLNL